MADNRVKFDDSWTNIADADYEVIPRERNFIHPTVQSVIRQASIAAKFLPSVPIDKGSKNWYVYTAVEPEPPKFDDNFMREDQTEIRRSESIFYPVYMHHDYKVFMTDNDAVASDGLHKMSLNKLTVQEVTKSIVDYKEKVIWRGYDITGRANAAANNQGIIDSSSLGICNTASINTFNAGDGDSVLTAAGDGLHTIGNGVEALVTDNYYGPYDFVMTPQVWAQYVKNHNATTDVADWENMSSQMDLNGSKLIKSAHVTKHLLNAAETTTTGAVVLIDARRPGGGPSIMLGDMYPVSNIPMSASRMAYEGKVIWAGIPAVIDPNCIATDTGITTN
jgi:hypothetical protein